MPGGLSARGVPWSSWQAPAKASAVEPGPTGLRGGQGIGGVSANISMGVRSKEELSNTQTKKEVQESHGERAGMDPTNATMRVVGL